jgi:hypothetical protein
MKNPRLIATGSEDEADQSDASEHSYIDEIDMANLSLG